MLENTRSDVMCIAACAAAFGLFFYRPLLIMALMVMIGAGRIGE